LISAARNEETHIEKTILSVLRQTRPPLKWVIVSDGSTDGTDRTVLGYAAKSRLIEFVRRENTEGLRGFASKVAAIEMGYQRLRDMEYDFVGNLDADLSFDTVYFEHLMAEFEKNPRLGIGGGTIYERSRDEFRSRPSNTVRSVAGGIQFFRRECYEEIGGLRPFDIGGEDWCAEIMARMAGWEVRAFPDLPVKHHKRSADARGALRENFRQGMVDRSLGTCPTFELAKCFRRLREAPFLIGPGCRMIGYVWSAFMRRESKASDEVRAYLRREQADRLRHLIVKYILFWRCFGGSAFTDF
jgi:glycosyltransferase involved in cell wall biosynthesis